MRWIVIEMSDMVNLVAAYTVMIGLIAAWSWMVGRRMLDLIRRLDAIETIRGSEEE